MATPTGDDGKRAGTIGDWAGLGIPYPRTCFALVVSAHCLGSMILVSVLASSPAIRADLGLSSTEMGLLTSAYAASLAFFSIPSGRLCDAFGVRASMFLAAAILSAGAISTAGSRSLSAALCGMFLCGLGYSLVNPAAGRAIQLWYPASLQGTLMGLKQTGVPLGGALGAAAAMLTPIVGWTWVVGAVGIITGVLGFTFALFPRHIGSNSLAASSSANGNTRHPDLRNPSLLTVNLASGVYSGGQLVIWTYFVDYLRSAAGMGAPTATAFLAVLQISSIAGRISWGVVSDRFFSGALPALVLVGALSAAFTALLVLVTDHTSPLLVFALTFFIGFTLCSTAGLQVSLVINSVEPGLSGRAIGGNIFSSNFGGILAPPIFGFILERSGTFSAPLAFYAACIALVTALLVLAARRRCC